MDTFDIPLSRAEAILQNMLGAENELGPAQSRIEALLLAVNESIQDYKLTPEEVEEIIQIL